MALRHVMGLLGVVAAGCQTAKTHDGASRAATAEVPAAGATSADAGAEWTGVAEGSGAAVTMAVLGSAGEKARVFLRVSRGAGAGFIYDAYYFSKARVDTSGRVTAANERCTLDATGASVTLACGAKRLSARASEPAAAASPVGRYAGSCGGRKTHASINLTWEDGGYLLSLMRADEGARLADMLTARTDAATSHDVTFRHATKPSSCELNGQDLVCDACKMTRQADATAPAALTLARADDGGDEETRPVAMPAQRQWYGHLRHERTGRAQLVAVNFSPGEDRVLANLDAALATRDGAVVLQYFGPGDSADFVAFRSAPATGSVLETDGDAVLAFDGAEDGLLKGTWYSKAFGRVGRFALAKDLVPDAPEGATPVPQLSGYYRAGAWTLELSTVTGDATAATARGMRLPLFGTVHDSQPASRRRAIVGGAYDPVSGQIALRLDDGRVMSGHVEAPASIVLHWVPWASLDGFGASGGTLRFERSDAVAAGQTSRRLLP